MDFYESTTRVGLVLLVQAKTKKIESVRWMDYYESTTRVGLVLLVQAKTKKIERVRWMDGWMDGWMGTGTGGWQYSTFLTLLFKFIQ